MRGRPAPITCANSGGDRVCGYERLLKLLLEEPGTEEMAEAASSAERVTTAAAAYVELRAALAAGHREQANAGGGERGAQGPRVSSTAPRASGSGEV